MDSFKEPWLKSGTNEVYQLQKINVKKSDMDMKGKQREMQLIFDNLEVRETTNEDGSPSKPIVSGYAIRFNEDSVKMYGYLTERINPSCVTDDVIKESDIKMTLFHNRQMLLARSNKGEGTLRLEVDKKGLKFEFEPADDMWGKTCLEHVQRGDLNGCSFTFIPGDYTIENRGDDDILVEHTRFSELLELTIGTDPAYPTTSVESSAREFADGIKAEQEALAEKVKAEAELQLRQKREREIALAMIDC